MRPPPKLAEMRGNVPPLGWPPVWRGDAAALAAAAWALEASQWWPADRILAAQGRALAAVAAHGAAHSKRFAARLAAAGVDARQLTSPAALAALPPITRADLQAGDWNCGQIPEGHGPTGVSTTSGSTGEPLSVRRTAIAQLDFMAITIRYQLWHGIDVAGRLAAIRANVNAASERPDWGPPASLLFDTGPSLVLPVSLSVGEQAKALAVFSPTTLMVYPSTLGGLIDEAVAGRLDLGALRHAATLGEVVTDALRIRLKKVAPLARIADCYSSQEAGYLAIECGKGGLYHVMAETLIVEVLRDDGSACAEGETGHVVVTDLRNLATPLIRYAIGDYAEVGPRCACGRALPTLRRIIGRERHLALRPDGSRYFPAISFVPVAAYGIAQAQFVQTAPGAMTLNFRSERELTPNELRKLAGEIHAVLDYPYELTWNRQPHLPRGPAGKFEEFVNRIGAGPNGAAGED